MEVLIVICELNIIWLAGAAKWKKVIHRIKNDIICFCMCFHESHTKMWRNNSVNGLHLRGWCYGGSKSRGWAGWLDHMVMKLVLHRVIATFSLWLITVLWDAIRGGIWNVNLGREVWVEPACWRQIAFNVENPVSIYSTQFYSTASIRFVYPIQFLFVNL